MLLPPFFSFKILINFPTSVGEQFFTCESFSFTLIMLESKPRMRNERYAGGNAEESINFIHYIPLVIVFVYARLLRGETIWQQIIVILSRGEDKAIKMWKLRGTSICLFWDLNPRWGHFLEIAEKNVLNSGNTEKNYREYQSVPAWLGCNLIRKSLS
jgi:hypothetical protein